MDLFTHVAIVAHFMAGNCVELISVDAIPPSDPEDGDAQFYRGRNIAAAARLLKGV